MANKKIAIVGSCTFNNYAILKKFINYTCSAESFTIGAVVSGGASLTDRLGEKYADEYGLEKIMFPAPLEDIDICSTDVRNEVIIKNCDVCFAFWDGHTKGCKQDIDLCQEFNKPCYVHRLDAYVSTFGV